MTEVLCSVMDCPFNESMVCQKEEVWIYKSAMGEFCMTREEAIHNYEHECREIFLVEGS